MKGVSCPGWPRSPMKLDPHLPQLPSIAELLEHPRVKGVVERINRSTVAQRATEFIEELRHSIAQRTGLHETPSVAHLAERLARRLLGDWPNGGLIINATGVVLGNSELTPPLADAAAHAMLQASSEYHSRRDVVRQHTVERLLSRLAQAEAGLIVSSVEAAAALALAATAASREAALVEPPNSEPEGYDWQWLAARAGTVLRRGSGADSVASIAERGHLVGAIVLAASIGDSVNDQLVRLSSLGRQQQASIIDFAPIAGLRDPRERGFPEVATIGQRLRAGADLVVSDGAGLLGGPSCGLLLGSRRHVDLAANHPLAALVSAEPVVLAGLQATLGPYEAEDAAAVDFALPVWQLLSTPLANLQQRAERLAALISAVPTVSKSEAESTEATWLQCGSQRLSAPTWRVAVLPRDGDATALAKSLRGGRHSIAAKQAEGAVHLDLRSVFPRWDQTLATALDSRES